MVCRPTPENLILNQPFYASRLPLSLRCVALHVALAVFSFSLEGMNQARALGEWWHTVLRTPIHKIYASDLKRANSTAVQLVAPRTALPDAHPLSCPPIHTTPLIREQHFGIAEGKLWSAGPAPVSKRQQRRASAASASNGSGTSVHGDAHGDDGKLLGPEVEVYETIRNRHERFTGGESLDDLALRADDAVERLVWPHLEDAIAIAHRHRYANGEGEGEGEAGVAVDGRPRENGGEVDVDVEGGLGYHVVLVSHGLCISEMIAALLRRSANAGATTGVRLKGLVNTGWTRVHIRPLVSDRFIIPHAQLQCREIHLKAGTRARVLVSPQDNGTLDISVVAVNQAPHLVKVVSERTGLHMSPADLRLIFPIWSQKRQSGGIGSAPSDEKQRSIREFFGGASAADATP